MKRLFFFTLLLYCVPLFLLSQEVVVRGEVRQAGNRQLLMYVNIGIRSANIGTITDKTGAFELILAPSHLSDTLTFSHVGFAELNVPVKEIVAGGRREFLLVEKPGMLQEVVVTNKKQVTRKLGTRSHNPFLFGVAESKSTTDIIEFAKRINVKKQSRLLDAHIFLQSPNIDSGNFRINFYQVQNDLPGERLVERSILKKLPLKQGWLTVDLSAYNIIVGQDFFIGFEFLPEQRTGKYSLSYGGQLGGSALTRNSSLGLWRKQSGATHSVYVTVKQ